MLLHLVTQIIFAVFSVQLLIANRLGQLDTSLVVRLFSKTWLHCENKLNLIKSSYLITHSKLIRALSVFSLVQLQFRLLYAQYDPVFNNRTRKKCSPSIIIYWRALNLILPDNSKGVSQYGFTRQGVNSLVNLAW